MAQDNQYPFGVHDFKVYKITALATPTYATGVNVGAIQEVTFDPVVTEAILRGDDAIVCTVTTIDGAEFTLTHGGLDLAAWEALMGASASDSGSTPNEVTWLDIKTSLNLPWFGFITQILDGETDGDTHIQAFKCMLNKLPPGTFGDGAFNSPQMGGRALPSPYDSDTIFRVLQHETKVTPPSSWPSQYAPYTSS